jgi:DNA-binding NarL/FixJ family response regulator
VMAIRRRIPKTLYPSYNPSERSSVRPSASKPDISPAARNQHERDLQSPEIQSCNTDFYLFPPGVLAITLYDIQQLREEISSGPLQRLEPRGASSVAARILIADDNLFVRKALRRVLEQTGGWEVIEADSGKEAVAKAREISFDLIILDLAMPEMDGFTCTREISKLLPTVPIVLHTLYWSPRIAIEALKAGARKAVPKSESGAIVAAVEELLAARPPRWFAIVEKLEPRVSDPEPSPAKLQAAVAPPVAALPTPDAVATPPQTEQEPAQEVKERKAG